VVTPGVFVLRAVDIVLFWPYYLIQWQDEMEKGTAGKSIRSNYLAYASLSATKMMLILFLTGSGYGLLVLLITAGLAMLNLWRLGMIRPLFTVVVKWWRSFSEEVSREEEKLGGPPANPSPKDILLRPAERPICDSILLRPVNDGRPIE